MPIGIGVREQLGEKVDLRCLGLSGWINFIWDEIDLYQSCSCPRENIKWGFWVMSGRLRPLAG